jgi:putative transposase
MPNCRRNCIPGDTYFFTVALGDRRSDLLVREIAVLREALARTRYSHPFRVYAWVVLPDPMHEVWTLPADDIAYSLRWSLIKRRFSAAIPPGEPRSP